MSTPKKTIVVVGAGSAGLAALKALLDVSKDSQECWEIALYERRSGIGGIWMPDLQKPIESNLPDTPLYPLLMTATPTPTMTYPHFPFRSNTPLFASHTHVRQYHCDYAEHFALWPFIHLNHTLTNAVWDGDSLSGSWRVTVRKQDGELIVKNANHLIVANGHNRHPNIPQYPGQDTWLANSAPGELQREIRHTVWYRDPEQYSQRKVLVVGCGASGQDSASHIVLHAAKIYQSVRKDYQPPSPIIRKPGISHFTSNEIVFTDGSSVTDVDSVLLGTGYVFRIPFLEEGNILTLDPMATSSSAHPTTLVNNLRYIFPLYRHVVSLSPKHPPTALMFIGLVIHISDCPADAAQGLFAAKVINRPDILPSREEMLAELAEREDHLRRNGWNPYAIGHRLVDGSEFEYQESLVAFLKRKGAIADDGKPYVDEWRREAKDLGFALLRRTWKRIMKMGMEEEWLKGVENEDDWVDLMRRVARWGATEDTL